VADIAAVFHWPLHDIDPMSLDDFARWWAKALARVNPPANSPDDTRTEGAPDG
jgi:hypothetical protein